MLRHTDLNPTSGTRASKEAARHRDPGKAISTPLLQNDEASSQNVHHRNHLRVEDFKSCGTRRGRFSHPHDTHRISWLSCRLTVGKPRLAWPPAADPAASVSL
jgi:hypothetical protein